MVSRHVVKPVCRRTVAGGDAGYLPANINQLLAYLSWHYFETNIHSLSIHLLSWLRQIIYLCLLLPIHRVCLGKFPGILDGKLWESWIRFAYDARVTSDLTWEMRPTGPLEGWNCDCRSRRRITYPHWPQATHKEAFDQLCMLTEKHNCHRRYLAHQWWVSVTGLSIENLHLSGPSYTDQI